MMDRKEFLKLAGLVAAGAVIPKPLLKQIPAAEITEVESSVVRIYTKDLISCSFAEYLPGYTLASADGDYLRDIVIAKPETKFALKMEASQFLGYRLSPGDFVTIVFEQGDISYILTQGTVSSAYTDDRIGTIEGVGGQGAWTAND